MRYSSVSLGKEYPLYTLAGGSHIYQEKDNHLFSNQGSNIYTQYNVMHMQLLRSFKYFALRKRKKAKNVIILASCYVDICKQIDNNQLATNNQVIVSKASTYSECKNRKTTTSKKSKSNLNKDCQTTLFLFVSLTAFNLVIIYLKQKTTSTKNKQKKLFMILPSLSTL